MTNNYGRLKRLFISDLISSKFKIIDVVNDTEGLYIRLKLENQKPDITVTFSGSLTTYTVTPKKYLIPIFAEIQKHYEDAFLEASCFVIESSDYLTWVYEESYGFYNENEPVDIKLKHYMILGNNLAFEILTNETPSLSSKLEL